MVTDRGGGVSDSVREALLSAIELFDELRDPLRIPDCPAHRHACREREVFEHRRVQRISDSHDQRVSFNPNRKHSKGVRCRSVDLLKGLFTRSYSI